MLQDDGTSRIASSGRLEAADAGCTSTNIAQLAFVHLATWAAILAIDALSCCFADTVMCIPAINVWHMLCVCRPCHLHASTNYSLYWVRAARQPPGPFLSTSVDLPTSPLITLGTLPRPQLDAATMGLVCKAEKHSPLITWKPSRLSQDANSWTLNCGSIHPCSATLPLPRF